MGRIKNILRNINYLSKHSLWDQREEDIVYLSSKILDDVMFEYDLEKSGSKKPVILDSLESIDLIFSSGKSFVRTGDGECKIIMGMDQPFQKYSEELANGLIKILKAYNDALLVGINRNYYIPETNDEYSTFYRRNAYDYRQLYKKYLDEKKTYIDATCTAYPLGNHNSQIVKEKFKRWKSAFNGRNIVIVCGEGILDKLDFDVFEMAKSKKYIYGPARDAWNKHDELIRQIKNEVKKDEQKFI